MKMTKGYIDGKLSEAQVLLWGGSETENIAAHNIIAKLIADLEYRRDLDKSDNV